MTALLKNIVSVFDFSPLITERRGISEPKKVDTSSLSKVSTPHDDWQMVGSYLKNAIQKVSSEIKNK